MDLWNNTPNTTNPTRAQVAEFGDDFLLSSNPGTPTAPNPYFYGYNYYHVQTDFEYIGFHTDLDNGWRFDDKLYTTRYWNKQNYQNGPTVNLGSAKPSGVDKLNGYRHIGDTTTISKESKYGIFRIGFWYDWAYTDRYQIPYQYLDERQHALGNFHEHFWTAGAASVRRVRMARDAETRDHRRNQGRLLQHALETVPGQRQDCRLFARRKSGEGSCDRRAHLSRRPPFALNTVNYNNVLPTLTARYRVWRNWSVYGQFAEGSVIPPSNVFDVPNAAVATPPKPTLTRPTRRVPL